MRSEAGRSGKLLHALKDAVMAPDTAVPRQTHLASPRASCLVRDFRVVNMMPRMVQPTTTGVTRSQESRLAANGIIQGHDPHAGTIRSTPLNRDLVLLVLSSASLPSPGA